MPSVVQKNFRIRNTYGQYAKNAKLPNLISLQKGSYSEFLEKRLPELLQKFLTFTDTPGGGDSHQKDKSSKTELFYESHKLDTPKYDIIESVQRGITYAAPLKVRLEVQQTHKIQDRLEDGGTGTGIKYQRDYNDVYLGDIPLQTDKGTFIINGTERVIVSQIQRSPGVFFYEEQSPTSQRMTYRARVVPYHGDWLDLEFDSRDLLYVRINKGRKLHISTLLRSMGYTKKQMLQMFYHTADVKFVKEVKLNAGEKTVYTESKYACTTDFNNKGTKEKADKKFDYLNTTLSEDVKKDKYAGLDRDYLKFTVITPKILELFNKNKIKPNVFAVKNKILSRDVINPNDQKVLLRAGQMIDANALEVLDHHKIHEIYAYEIDRAYKQIVHFDYLRNQKLYFSLTDFNGVLYKDENVRTLNVEASIDHIAHWFDKSNKKIEKKDLNVSLLKDYDLDGRTITKGQLADVDVIAIEKHLIKKKTDESSIFADKISCKLETVIKYKWTLDKSAKPYDFKDLPQFEFAEDLRTEQVVFQKGNRLTFDETTSCLQKMLEANLSGKTEGKITPVKLSFKVNQLIYSKTSDSDKRDVVTTIDDALIRSIQSLNQKKIEKLGANSKLNPNQIYLPVRFEHIKDNVLAEDVYLDGKVIKQAGDKITDQDLDLFKANGLSIKVCFIDDEYFTDSIYKTIEADFNREGLNDEKKPNYTETISFSSTEESKYDIKNLGWNTVVLAKDTELYHEKTKNKVILRAGDVICATYTQSYHVASLSANDIKTNLKGARYARDIVGSNGFDIIRKQWDVIAESDIALLQKENVASIDLLHKHPDILLLEEHKATIEIYNNSSYDPKVEDVKEMRLFLRNYFLQVFKPTSMFISKAEGLVLASDVYSKKGILLKEALSLITAEDIKKFQSEKVEFEAYCTAITRVVKAEELDKSRGYTIASDVVNHDGTVLKYAQSSEPKLSASDVELFKALNLSVEIYQPNIDLNSPNIEILFGSTKEISAENRAFFKDHLNFFFGNHRILTDDELLQISTAILHVNRNIKPADNTPKNPTFLFNTIFRRFYSPIGGIASTTKHGEYASSTNIPKFNGNYDLKPYGRIKLNHKFRLNVPENYSWLTKNDIVESVRYILALKDNNTEIYRPEIKFNDENVDNAEKMKLLQKSEAIRYTMTLAEKPNVFVSSASWKPSLLDIKIDDIDHLGNRRVSLVGELIENQYQVGLIRMQKTFKEKGSKTAPQVEQTEQKTNINDLLNAKAIQTALKEYFASSQLSQFMDQTNPLSEVTHKRRLSALGPGGLNRDRAGFEVRDVHMSHYGRICPIETPEGANIGLIASLSTFARINNHGFIETPYRRVKVENQQAFVDFSEDPKYYNALEEEFSQYINVDNDSRTQTKIQNVAQAKIKIDETGLITEDNVYVRSGEDFKNVRPVDIHLVDVSPNQMVSVAASLIPFLENDDANRALMGSNMQRQAVPLLVAEAPLVGTGIEINVGKDSGVTILAKTDGIVESVDSERIVIRQEGKNHLPEVYNLTKFRRSNQNTCINQKPLVEKGDIVKAGDVIADGPSTEKGELALGRNVVVAFMPWCGYNFEDSILISEKLVQDDVYTSIHIEEFECVARDTKGTGTTTSKEEITKDIPGVDPKQLAQLERSGIVKIGAEVKTNDILVGKITPKVEHQPTPEEKLLRAIFGEKAQDVKNTSLTVPHGMSGTVIGSKVFSRAVPPSNQSKLLVIKNGGSSKNASASDEIELETIRFVNENFKVGQVSIHDEKNMLSKISFLPEKHTLRIEIENTELEDNEKDTLEIPFVDGSSTQPFRINFTSQKGVIKIVEDADLKKIPSNFKVTIEDNFKQNSVDQENQDIQYQHDLEAEQIKKETNVVKNILKNHVKEELKKLLLGQQSAKSVLDVNGDEIIRKNAKISATDLENINDLEDLKNIDIKDEAIQNECKLMLAELETKLTEKEIQQNAKIKKISDSADLPAGVLKMVKVYVAIKRKLQVGDKMAGRHGNKGVVSRVLPVEDMPFLADGTPVEMVLNPLGVPSRMNIGQILETHLGWAARNLGKKINRMLNENSSDDVLKAELKAAYKNSHQPEFFDGLSSKDLHNFIRSIERGTHVATPVFDSASNDDLKHYLKLAGLREDARSELYDGRTGEKFDNLVTVGIMYVLKLHHLVDDKIHARSIGPYSLVTQQPLGGKAQFGGQRLGEMEVWAMEAYGAAYTLQEFLTVKSDDREGRTKMYQNIVKGQNDSLDKTCSLPESFKVLLKELQSLALDIELISDHEE